MPRMPKYLKQEWAFFLDERGRKKYNELCRPKFGLASFDEILRFTEEVKQYVPDVTMSVVGFSIPQPDIEDCRRIAEKLGVKFRVR